ncbi:DUF805 domain-containing protein [Massilia aquatica]|uniref:DUF805 domain-containing protein n=1 Tax=Massilia aquatica TaxID=2609000 RepID=A0ABX0M8K8_9BURK|nr:DUF805 domain-containing protein [Massilia aquatica]
MSTPAPAATPRLLQLAGRIGRVRFMAYALAPAVPLLYVAPWMVDIWWSGPGVAARLPFLLALAVIASRRLRDIGLPWWLAALLLAPLSGAWAWLHLALLVLLAVIPGSQLPNRDGAPPCPPPGWMTALACLWLVPPLVMLALVVALSPKPEMPSPGAASVSERQIQSIQFA